MGQALERLPRRGAAPSRWRRSPTASRDEHLHFPGTMTLTARRLLATVTEIGESVYRAGFRKLLFANGHGGQPQVMEMAARELRLRHGDFVVRAALHVSRLPHAAGSYLAEQEKRLAMHAGHAETALMLALAPETVHMERAVANYPPVFPIQAAVGRRPPGLRLDRARLRPQRRHRRPAAAPRREQGQEILDTLADSWARGITELHALQWVVRERARPGATATSGPYRRRHAGLRPAARMAHALHRRFTSIHTARSPP